jgi:hypothetical protein
MPSLVEAHYYKFSIINWSVKKIIGKLSGLKKFFLTYEILKKSALLNFLAMLYYF